MDTSQPLRSTSSTVRLYDTTLRDGTQREGLSFSCKDKIRIAKRLDEFGFTFVEGGWPGSNPKDQEFFERTKYLELSNAKLTAFGSTRRANKSPAEDPQITSLLGAETSVCTVFGKSSLLHVCEVLRTTREENLDMIEDTVRFLRSQGRRVLYDAEHFFDGYKEDAAYAVETLWAAIRGGAEVLVLCDTNGGSLPWEIEPVVRSLVDQLDDHPLGIHAHDDTGCGVANSLAAIRGGARHVQGTINGYGERCGNANLCAIVPNLELKLNLECVGSEKLKELFDIAHMVSELANMLPNEHMAYVGHSAFAHKGGVHVAA
ncbi:MAG: citramalate synthase, partial [Myxococcota bacterium]